MNCKPLFTGILVASAAIAQTGLTGITWDLTTLNGTSVGSGLYTVKFNANGEANGKVDCNSCGWSYTTAGTSITILPGMCTMMACIGPTRDYEYQTTLTSAATYAISGAALYLIKNNDTIAAFVDEARASKVPITGAWQLDKLNHSALNLSGYTLTFTSDSTCGARMQCNVCSYHYAATLQAISFSRAMCTLRPCQGESREGECTTAMGNVTKWSIAGSKLFLMSNIDTLLEYSAAPPVLSGKVWLLQSIRQTSGRTAITDPGNYTASFAEGGTISVQSDCNTCNGAYSENATAGTLSISSLACTKMMCSAGSKDGLFTSILESVQKFVVRGDTLFCFSSADTLFFLANSTAIERSAYTAARPISKSGYTVFIKNGYIIVDADPGYITHVRLVNVQGVCVKRTSKFSGRSVRIDAGNLPSGMYMIQVSTSGGFAVSGMINCTK
jgi:heat shock protein HslJ